MTAESWFCPLCMKMIADHELIMDDDGSETCPHCHKEIQAIDEVQWGARTKAAYDEWDAAIRDGLIKEAYP